MSARLIVEVRGGRGNGDKTVIDPGQTLRFGRTEVADVVVPHDEMLSGVHFDLAWDGATCRLRDRRSHQGTTLDGEPVLTAVVPHGGWIRAGRTDFLVYVEGKSAAPPPEDDSDLLEYMQIPGDPPDAEEPLSERALLSPEEAERLRRADAALAQLRAIAEGRPLYAVLDAARDPKILEILRESVEKHQSLYEGVDGEAMEEVAPYLAGPMRSDSMLLDRLVREGWGRRWGVFAETPLPFKFVRRHLRRFLMIDLTETEEKVYFRYYDPVVLVRFLGLWTPAQRAQMTDGPTRLLAEGPSLEVVSS